MSLLRRLFERERRIYPRVPVVCDVMYGISEPFTVSTIYDLSLSGVALRTSRTFELGTRIEVRIMPQGPQSESWIELEGIVRRSQEQVLAVEFVSIGGQQRAGLERLLPAEARVPTLAPQPQTQSEQS
jgi:hypothetical protein